MQREVVVIGAGVVGLSTAAVLLDAGWTVTVVSDEPPAEVTSMAGTGLVGLAFGEPREFLPAWEQRSVALFEELVGTNAGVRHQRGLFATRTDTGVPPPMVALAGFRVAASAELPAGFSSGFWLDNIVIDVTVYLPWLARRVASAGGRIEQRHTSIDDAFDAAAVVVNCSGSRAADITDDPFVEPDWGMHVIVANDLGIDHHFMEGPPGLARWVSWMPHGDLLLIGGASIVGRRYRRPDAGIADELCAAAIEALPALAEAPVIGANAGLRPRRPAVRVEHDHHARGKLIHNYGHGGLGLTLSWGTAHRVAELLEGTT